MVDNFSKGESLALINIFDRLLGLRVSPLPRLIFQLYFLITITKIKKSQSVSRNVHDNHSTPCKKQQ